MTATVKRASTPRKTAKRETNGAAAPDPLAVSEEMVRDPGSPEAFGVAHPPPFIWHPRDGSPEIVLPHINTANPTQEFFCRIYDLNEMFQSFEWLILAGVPKEVRLRVAALGDTDPQDQANLFKAWFAPITRPAGLEPPGES